MTQKKARRWLARNKWHIAKLHIGMYKSGGSFCQEYLAYKHALDPNILTLNSANQHIFNPNVSILNSAIAKVI